MKNKKQRAGKRFMYNPFYQAGLLALGVLLVYYIFAYPCYTLMKVQMMKNAYRILAEFELGALDTEDEEILEDLKKSNLEITIADENFELIYSNRQVKLEERINDFMKKYVDRFQEIPTVYIRGNRELRVIRLRGLLQQGQDKYYIYMRKEIRQIGEFIRYTSIYFLVAAGICAVLWYRLCYKKAGEMNKKLLAEAAQGALAPSSVREELMQAQREFVANISHELKTPLAVISGQIEMLQYMGNDIDRDYYFSSIREEIDKMSELVGSLLDLTIMDHRVEKMEMTRVNASEMMEYMILKYDALFHRNKIKLETLVEKNCFVRGNRMYLEQAVNNYIMNAFQHTAQGRRMEVTLKKTGEKARISVYNDGKPIAPEEQSSIWQSFYMKSGNTGSDNGKNKNAGLGLYIVRKILEQHHGCCGMENRENGVEFWMDIPLDDGN